MLQIKVGTLAWKTLTMVGLCGEVPLPMFHSQKGCWDYWRRVITKLVRESYLREWKMKDGRGRVVRSLSLLPKGLEKLEELTPNAAQWIREKRLSSGPAYGDRDRAMRLHRNAWCFTVAGRMGAFWQPVDEKQDCLGRRAVYYGAYELNHTMGWDNKGSRLSGVFVDRDGWAWLLYYFGRSNMHWNSEVERGVRERLWDALRGPDGRWYPCKIGGNILIAEDWTLAEELLHSGTSRYTKLFRLDRKVSSYCITTDRDGVRLFQLLVDPDKQIAFQQALYNTGLTRESRETRFLFSLEELRFFYQDAEIARRFFPPVEGLFLECQREGIEKINRGQTPIRLISQQFWDAWWENNKETF